MPRIEWRAGPTPAKARAAPTATNTPRARNEIAVTRRAVRSRDFRILYGRRVPVGRRRRHRYSRELMPTTKTAGPAITPGIGRVTRVLTGIGLAAFVLPLPAVIDDHSAAVAGTALPGLVIAAGAAGLVWWRCRASASALGGVVVAACAWLFSQARAGSTNWLLAALLGVGIALALPRPQVRDRLIQITAGVFAAVLVAVAAVRDAGTAWTIGILTGVTLIVVAVRRPAVPGQAGWLLPVTGLLGILLLGSWIGANSPTADWFGPTIAHGPRSRPQVAITFDDGPNSGATLTIAHILDAHGVKGTFFIVGKAVDARPEIIRELIADGQLVGNHSYHHDEWRWLDPRYPELQRTQHAIRERDRRVPGLLPPAARATHAVHGMGHGPASRTDGRWDVSAGDWATNDRQPHRRRVLDRRHARIDHRPARRARRRRQPLTGPCSCAPCRSSSTDSKPAAYSRSGSTNSSDAAGIPTTADPPDDASEELADVGSPAFLRRHERSHGRRPISRRAERLDGTGWPYGRRGFHRPMADTPWARAAEKDQTSRRSFALR